MSQESDTIPAPDTGPLLEAFENLARKCDELPQQHRLVQQNEPVYTAAQLAARKALLTMTGTTMLPLLRQQFIDLQESLDLAASDTPSPNLDLTQQHVKKIGETLDEIFLVANTLAPSITSLGRYSSRNDHNYGVAKQFKCDNNLQQLRDLASALGILIRNAYVVYIRDGHFLLPNTAFPDESRENNSRKVLIADSELMLEIFEVVIAWSQESSSSAVQKELQGYDQTFGTILKELNEHINAAIRSQEEQSANAGARLAAAPDNNQAERNNNQRGREANQAGLQDNQDEDADLSDDAEEGALAGAPPPPEEFLLRPRVVELMRLILPLLKLCRSFFRRVWRQPSSNPRFTIGEDMCSYDLDWLIRQSLLVSERLESICKNLYLIYSEEDIGDGYLIINDLANQVRGALDAFIVSIIRSQIRLTMENFLDALSEFERDAP
ncbi:hypothetical protein PTTG_27079 [Puccinia triticina 1-1 BBBD Race 1]|uniref:Uncharacterized protein n=1 Tax=Puccinia triticina (isolate 1-1 / race 1 (BBBD)) TaxID=630390 RepID=A0A180GQK6_PUCT1|nr:hypothetical protein PTTG_27079 [Puccinia triticina 1-1 BBBD Race 1]WAR57108.1 hypothetical protein PtB15_8B154 [Puccinia triticina]